MSDFIIRGWILFHVVEVVGVLGGRYYGPVQIYLEIKILT